MQLSISRLRVLTGAVALLIAAGFSVPAWAQIKNADSVGRVANRLACQCGSCSHSVAACTMYGCFSQHARERIAKLQATGMPDQKILDQFVSEYGQGILLAVPSAFGWLVPCASILAGLALLFWFVKRYRRPKPLAEIGPLPDDPALAKYQEQIEKDLARLD